MLVPFDKQIYIYLKMPLKSEVRSVKFQLKMAAKKLMYEIPINLS